MLGPFATASRRYNAIHQVSLLSHASYSYSAGGVRCPRRQRQRVTEGTAMAPWNGPNQRRTTGPPRGSVGTLCSHSIAYVQVVPEGRVRSTHGLQRGRRAEQHHHHLPAGDCHQHHQPVWLLGLVGLYRQFLRYEIAACHLPLVIAVSFEVFFLSKIYRISLLVLFLCFKCNVQWDGVV